MNFTGTKYEGMTEDEIFRCSQTLVKATVVKAFPNKYEFCSVHMIDVEELEQFGNLGLLTAIRTFDAEQTSFNTYAINNIKWTILKESKKYSLRNLDDQSYEIAEHILDAHSTSEEEVSVIDSLESPYNSVEEHESNMMVKEVLELITNDPDSTDEILRIIEMRMEDKSDREIARILGMNHVRIERKMNTKSAKRLKKRVAQFLEEKKYA